MMNPELTSPTSRNDQVFLMKSEIKTKPGRRVEFILPLDAKEGKNLSVN